MFNGFVYILLYKGHISNILALSIKAAQWKQDFQIESILKFYINILHSGSFCVSTNTETWNFHK